MGGVNGNILIVFNAFMSSSKAVRPPDLQASDHWLILILGALEAQSDRLLFYW